MKLIKLLLLSLVTLIAACSQPLPSDKKDYAGYWVGGDSQSDTKLLIRSDGYVIFERRNVNQRGEPVHPTRISGPIIRFMGNDFMVGPAEPGAHFKITQSPTQVGDSWAMNLDGFPLVKKPESEMTELFLKGEESHDSDEFDGLNGDH